ncbi:MAG: efflux RND transporter periplasmic adaptor subunit [Pseudomonadota bacterium]
MRALFGIFLLAACADAAADPGAEAPPPTVKLAEARPIAAALDLSVTGTVRLDEETDLAFTSAGRIARVTVDTGDRVKRGQRLAALDSTTVGADLEAARAEQRRARAELARNRDLFDQGWVTRAVLDNLEATLRSANARVESAGFAARTATIDAPADGVILARMGDPGQTVQAGAPVLSFGGASEGFVLSVPLTDRLAAGRRMGEAASVNVAALGPGPIPARLTELAGRADPATGTFLAEFTLTPRAGLRSGQVGSVTLAPPATDSDQTAADALIIPTSALFAARAGAALVWRYDPADNTVTPQEVVPGPLSDNGVRIERGLKAGDRVVIAGLEELSPGAEVVAR